ncbi:MAG: 4a-hydroxytetrahydrobiopterin dehydratase [Ignavibacteria bacterium]|nr:4a-hydroxytetrahydrobiopterin dehydratase [Ignavibacteria bacterium]
MNLKDKKCLPCEGGILPFTEVQANEFLNSVKGWKLAGKKIEKEFTFKDFLANVDFVNKVATISEAEGHHPDILIYSWNKLRITIWTHSIGGLSENDFILAAKIDELKL